MAALSISLAGSGKLFGQALSDDGLFAVPTDSLSDPLNYLQKDHFEVFTGSVMRARLEDGRTVNLRLKEVTANERRANLKNAYRGENFSLLFEPASSKRILGGIYEFDHEGLGKFRLMISPVGKTGTAFEAVVNRLGR